MMRVTTIVVAAMTLAGCSKPPVESAGAAGTACDAAAVQDLVGKPADAVLAEAQRRSGARDVRRYTTGDMLTMDMRPDRLNVEADAGGSVVKISCG